MKNNSRNHIIAFITVLTGLLSCDKGFHDINTSIDFVSTPNLDYELPYVELTMEDRNYYTPRTIAPIVCQVDAWRSFNQIITEEPEAYHGEHFKWIYQQPLRTVVDLIEHAKKDPNKINYVSIGRILKVYLFHQLTDLYGDVPYFEANKGYTDQILQPNYDPQQKIYEDMFKELTEATQAFDNAKPVPASSDIVYQGDIIKWQKFANSLMLRLALRIMKVEPDNGKKYIDQAISGGLLTGNEDNFVVNHQPNSSNTTTAHGMVEMFVNASESAKQRLTSAFVDSLKNRNDPRTTVYCMRPTAPFSSSHDGDHTFANQRGWRQFNDTSVPHDSCSTSNVLTLARYDAPTVHLSYAQVQFQLAECVVRGLINGDAKTYYENGVRAAMDELSIYGPAGVISSADQEAYLLLNPYDPVNALNMINTQYWIETHYNWFETFANMRRCGYPDTYSSLDMTEPANFGAQLPRRFLLPPSEVIANSHVQDAIARQGPDLTTTRVWWDKP